MVMVTSDLISGTLNLVADRSTYPTAFYAFLCDSFVKGAQAVLKALYLQSRLSNNVIAHTQKDLGLRQDNEPPHDKELYKGD